MAFKLKESTKRVGILLAVKVAEKKGYQVEANIFGIAVLQTFRIYGYVKEMENQDRMKSVAVKKLMIYGNENPMAFDTAEGIAKWWVKMPIEVVLPALETLVEIGIWEKLRREDRALYRPLKSSIPIQQTVFTDPD